MIEKILNFKNYSYTNEELKNLENEIVKINDARLIFLYLYYVSDENKKYMENLLLKTGDFCYIHYFLRSFYVEDYYKYLDYILLNNEDSKYLFNILYDVDYLDEKYMLKIIYSIVELNDIEYIFKALYYYFIVLDLYNENLFSKCQTIFYNNFSLKFDHNNYKLLFDNIIRNQNNTKIPKGYSKNFYKGRKGYVPNIIVCHISNIFSSIIYHFYNDTQVSSHFVIRKDGYVKKVVSLNNSAWANGTSINESSDVYYKFGTSKLINSVRENANYFTFSIEFESFHGNLTESQLDSAIKVMCEIIDYVKYKYNYDFEIDRKHIIGHYEVNPIVRKNCPGKEFPVDIIIKRLKSIYK